MGDLTSAFKLILILIMGTPGILCQNTKPTFKIQAPNILCSKGMGSGPPPTVFSINLIPANPEEKLKYHTKISYEYSMPQRTQHHSLSIWRTVRTLEQQLNTQKPSIDAENKIDIATSILTPGVIYMFDIVGENADGVESDAERFVLDYKDGNLYQMCKDQGNVESQGVMTTTMQTSVIGSNSSSDNNPDSGVTSTTMIPNAVENITMVGQKIVTVVPVTSPVPVLVPTTVEPIPVTEIGGNSINGDEVIENFTEETSSIRLSGPSKITANMPLIIKADATFLGNVNEYFIQWKIDDIAPESRNILAVTGSVINIPPFTFMPRKKITIEADLMDASNSKSVANANVTVDIEIHELQLSIIPVNALIGVGRSIDIELKIKDFNIKKGKFNIHWRCVVIEEGSEAESLCDRFNDVSEPKKSIIFTKPGKYHMEATIVNELNLTAEVISLIEVRNDIIARTVIDSMPQLPVDVTCPIRAQASISYVVPKCIAKWSIVKMEGYEYEDTSVLKGGIGELIVNDFEANFLKDLNDYTNSTVTKHVKLNIPPANVYPNWNGLKPDSSYRLRLITECPPPIDLDKQPQHSPNTKKIESFLEIDLHTNGPPIPSELHVEPSEGSALTTPFKFKTSPGKDKHGPLLYSFGVVFDDSPVILETGYELYEIQSILPHSKTPLKTFYEVCDMFKACSIQYGASISTNLSTSELVFDFTRAQLDAIESGLDRGEFNSSLNKMLFLGMTLKHISDDRIYKEFHQNIIQMLKAQTIRILKTYEDKSGYLSEQDILNYVQNVKRILEAFGIHNRDIIQNLLALLENVSGKGQAISEAKDIKKKRKRRQTNGNIKESRQNPVVDLAIGVLALLPPDTNRTKEELRWMCRYTEYREEKNMTEYHIIKFNKTHDFRQVIHKVPSVGFEWRAEIKLNNLYEFDPNMEYCIGSTYDRSYKYPVYQLYVFSSSDTENFHFVPLKEQESKGEVIEISVHLNNTIRPENAICEMLLDDTWTESTCIKVPSKPKMVGCNCTKNEPFRVKLQLTSNSDQASLSPAIPITPSMTTESTISTQTQTKEGSTFSSPAPMISEDESNGSTLAAVGYSALALLVLGAVFGVTSILLYRNMKKKNNTFALDLQAITAEARTKRPGLTYARFHDEHMMQGDLHTAFG
uniref:CSON007492 protein n=1 Tax=Culicoides sonorensis TaxID=179676 RepID=A0A336M191_CULSO